jgi:hypothetical protein
MAKARYQPPEQGALGMTFDAVLMLVLVFVSLSAPLWIANLAAPDAAADTAAEAAPTPTWESLGQSPTMVAAWEKLGKDPTAAAAIINNKFDYTIDPVKLGLTALLLIAYYFFMLRLSDREYREVIAEKFDQ